MGVRVSVLLRRYMFVYMYRFSSDIADPSGSNNSNQPTKKKKKNGLGGKIERKRCVGGFSSREDGDSGVMPRNDRGRRAGVNGLWSPV